MSYFKILRIAVFFALVILIAACKKYVPGAQGEPGTPGTPGNLVQSHVNEIRIDSMAWTLNTMLLYWDTKVTLPQITKDVIEKGEVRLYLYDNSQWCTLPYGKKYIFTQFSLQVGFIYLKVTHIHSGQPDRPANATYRAVIFSPPS